MTNRVFGVAGGAKIKYEHLDDLLRDWLLLDTDTPITWGAYVPADRKLTSGAVLTFLEWAQEATGEVVAIVSDTPGRKGEIAAEDAHETIDAQDDVAEHLISLLVDAKTGGDDAYLLLAWGDSEAAPDEHTEHLLDLAIKAGIPVKDLTNGLDDLIWDDEDEEESAGEDADDEPEPRRDADEEIAEELTEEEEELTGAEPDEAQANPPAPVSSAPADQPSDAGESPEYPDLLTVLYRVCDVLTYLDRINAAMNLDEPRYRPLTRAVAHHLKRLMLQEKEGSLKTQETAPKPQEEETARPRRGKPRDVENDIVVAYIDEERRTIRKAEGRGRPRKGEVRYELTRAEYKAIADEYGVPA